MPRTIFFSWQSDTPTRIGRNFLSRILERICKKLSSDTAIDEPIHLDSDTRGVAGQPPVTETILRKIDESEIFVADMTFTGKRSNGEPTPNPNVLIEYGWALKTLGHNRVIYVMNTAYGKPSRESLPFDLGHLRWPLQFNIVEDASPEAIEREKKELAKSLETAIRKSLSTPPPMPAKKASISVEFITEIRDNLPRELLAPIYTEEIMKAAKVPQLVGFLIVHNRSTSSVRCDAIITVNSGIPSWPSESVFAHWYGDDSSHVTIRSGDSQKLIVAVLLETSQSYAWRVPYITEKKGSFYAETAKFPRSEAAKSQANVHLSIKIQTDLPIDRLPLCSVAIEGREIREIKGGGE